MSTEDYINHDYGAIKDDQRKRGGCGKPGHVTSPPDPSEGEASTFYCITCEEEAKRAEAEQFKQLPDEQIDTSDIPVTDFSSGVRGKYYRGQPDDTCKHVPARPDVDLTICWICGVEIIPDPATHLWRPLTDTEKLVKYETVRQLRDLFHAVHPSEFSRITFERLEYKDRPAIRLGESILGRWIIVHAQQDDLAWSGSRWVPHRNGVPVGPIHVSNWETREEAEAYANKHFPQTGY